MVFEKILGHLLKTSNVLLPMNSIKKRYHLLVYVVLALLSSCTPVKNIIIELPKKAEQELPQDIQSLVLINRTVDSSYTDLETDSLQNIFFAERFNLDTIIKDLQVADTLLKAMGDLLFESGRYDIVIPENRFIPHNQNAFFSESLAWDDAKHLCEEFSTDAVLSVDMLKTRVITKYDSERFFNPLDNNFYAAAEAQMGIVYEALLRVYEPKNENVLLREFLRDTIIWEDMAGTAQELFQNFTSVKQGLAEAGIALALDFTEKISTSWIPERRSIFASGDDQMKLAGTYIDDGDWNAAEEIWKNIAEKSSSKSTKSKALYNLAVAAEIGGNLDEAISIGLKSYETMFQQQTYDYLERLKQRKQELKKQNK